MTIAYNKEIDYVSYFIQREHPHTFLNNRVTKHLCNLEAVIWKCSSKSMLLKIWQNLQENISAGKSFL